MIHLRLSRVSSNLQIGADVRGLSGIMTSNITSVHFSTCSHGRGTSVKKQKISPTQAIGVNRTGDKKYTVNGDMNVQGRVKAQGKRKERIFYFFSPCSSQLLFNSRICD